MDSKPRRTISDIRPARSMDGVTPSGNRRPSRLPASPSVQAAEPVAGPAAPVPDSITQGPQIPAKVTPVAAARPLKKASPEVVEPTPIEEKKKSGLLKKIVKVVIGLVVLGLVAAGGWMVYVNYFR